MQNWPNLQRRELQAEEKLEIRKVVSDIINRNIMTVLMHLKYEKQIQRTERKVQTVYSSIEAFPKDLGDFFMSKSINLENPQKVYWQT